MTDQKSPVENWLEKTAAYMNQEAGEEVFGFKRFHSYEELIEETVRRVAKDEQEALGMRRELYGMFDSIPHTTEEQNNDR